MPWGSWGAPRTPGTGAWEGGSGVCTAGQARGHPWGDRDTTGCSCSSHCPCLSQPRLGLGFGDGEKRHGEWAGGGLVKRWPENQGTALFGGRQGGSRNPTGAQGGSVTLVRARKTRKVIGAWVEGAPGPETPAPPPPPGPRPSLVVPAPRRPGTLAPAPGSVRVSGPLVALQPSDTGSHGRPPCTLQVLQNTPWRGPTLPAPHPGSPCGSAQVTPQGLAELGQPLSGSRPPRAGRRRWASSVLMGLLTRGASAVCKGGPGKPSLKVSAGARGGEGNRQGFGQHLSSLGAPSENATGLPREIRDWGSGHPP